MAAPARAARLRHGVPDDAAPRRAPRPLSVLSSFAAGRGSARGRRDPAAGGTGERRAHRGERRLSAEAQSDASLSDARVRFAFLAETSRVLANSLDVETTLATGAGL